jgi:hypothetical protein
MEKISLTRKELESFATNALGIAKLALRRMSTQFLAQLLQLKIKGDTRAFHMVDEIKHLEKLRQGIASMACDEFKKASDGWIVFKCYNGNNYYLTLAKLNDGDQNINQRVRDAYEFDFPFLQNMQRVNRQTG